MMGAQVALNAIVICWVSANSYGQHARPDEVSVPTLNVGPLLTKVGSEEKEVSSHETKEVQTVPGGGEMLAGGGETE
jgi:hypothetical protein